MADMCALLLLFYRYLLTAGLRTVDSQQLGLMQHGLCYVIHLTIECGFSETDVCPTHLCLLQVQQPPRQQCGRQLLVIRTLGMQFTPQLHPSCIQLHRDKLTEELNASSALQELVCAAQPLPAHLQHRELASSDPVCHLLASHSAITEKPGKKNKTDLQQGPRNRQHKMPLGWVQSMHEESYQSLAPHGPVTAETATIATPRLNFQEIQSH